MDSSFQDRAAARDDLARLADRTGFLVWAAVCCGVFVGVATDLAWSSGTATRIAAAVLALLAGLAVVFGVPYLALRRRPSPRQPQSMTRLPPRREPAVPAAPAPAPAADVPAPDPGRDELLGWINLGVSLRERLLAAPQDADAAAHDVDDWIAAAGRALENRAPRFAGYFAALRAHPALESDPLLRLERHLARLQTIVHESL